MTKAEQDKKMQAQNSLLYRKYALRTEHQAQESAHLPWASMALIYLFFLSYFFSESHRIQLKHTACQK